MKKHEGLCVACRDDKYAKEDYWDDRTAGQDRILRRANFPSLNACLNQYACRTIGLDYASASTYNTCVKVARRKTKELLSFLMKTGLVAKVMPRG